MNQILFFSRLNPSVLLARISTPPEPACSLKNVPLPLKEGDYGEQQPSTTAPVKHSSTRSSSQSPKKSTQKHRSSRHRSSSKSRSRSPRSPQRRFRSLSRESPVRWRRNHSLPSYSSCYYRSSRHVFRSSRKGSSQPPRSSRLYGEGGSYPSPRWRRWRSSRSRSR